MDGLGVPDFLVDAYGEDSGTRRATKAKRDVEAENRWHRLASLTMTACAAALTHFTEEDLAEHLASTQPELVQPKHVGWAQVLLEGERAHIVAATESFLDSKVRRGRRVRVWRSLTCKQGFLPG